MARFDVEYFSNALQRPVRVHVVIPNDPRLDIPQQENPYRERPMKTVFNLPGYTGGAGWGNEMTAAQYNTAFVSVYGENMSYIDNLAPFGKHGTFVGVELVDYVRKTFGLAMRREDTYITGISMGGYGALRLALAYPETFGKTAGQSSGLGVLNIAGIKPGETRRGRSYDFYKFIYGDLDKVEESPANPEYLVKQILAEGKPMPEIYMCCGTEDFLLEPNRAFEKFLTEMNVPHMYEEGPGGHEAKFWNEFTPKVMKWFFVE